MVDRMAYFEGVTKYPLSDLLEAYESFMESDRGLIEGYYAGTSSDIPTVSFYNLELILVEFDTAIELFMLHKNNFSDMDSWDLFEIVDDCKIALGMVKASDKFLHSFRTQVGFSTKSTVDYIQSWGESLEDIAKKQGADSFDNDWTEIALQNGIIEEDYTENGGLKLKVQTKGSQSIYVDVVVDSGLSDIEFYGRDLNRKLTIVIDDEGVGDLDVLGNNETLEQAIGIYMGLKKGNNPERPNDGIDPAITSGTNIGSFQFPIILRQLSDTFDTDDTFTSIEPTNTYIEEDNAFIDFEIYDILNKRTSSVSF